MSGWKTSSELAKAVLQDAISAEEIGQLAVEIIWLRELVKEAYGVMDTEGFDYWCAPAKIVMDLHDMEVSNTSPQADAG